MQSEGRLKTQDTAAAELAVTRSVKIPHLRWWIIGMVFLVTLMNYLDRLTISVLAPVIREDLALSNLEYASIGTWFLLAYTISQTLSGKLYDRIGTRLGFACSVTVWSLAAMGHALARGVSSLSAFRFVLGLGEAGNWPGAAKAVAEWFPIRERAFGMAIFNSGAALGSVIAPPIIVWLQLTFGWQATFLITGALGFVWLPLWLVFYRTPDQHPRITPQELRLIGEGQREETTAVRGHGNEAKRMGEWGKGGMGEKEKGGMGEWANGRRDETVSHSPTPPLSHSISTSPILPFSHSFSSPARPVPLSPTWRDLLGYRQVWAIVLSRLLVDPIWWLYIFWLPEYLNKARGFSLKEIGLFAWVPYVAADAGSLLGGWLSGHLISRGWSVNRARKSVIVGAALLMPAGILAARAEHPMTALALIGLVLFGFQIWINNVQTLPSDFFSDKAVASVAGLGGTGAGIGSMMFTLTTGWVVDHFSYTPILMVAGLLAPIGTVVLFTLAGPITRVRLRSAGT